MARIEIDIDECVNVSVSLMTRDTECYVCYVSVMCVCVCRYAYDKGNERHVRHAYVNVYMCVATGTGTHPGEGPCSKMDGTRRRSRRGGPITGSDVALNKCIR